MVFCEAAETCLKQPEIVGSGGRASSIFKQEHLTFCEFINVWLRHSRRLPDVGNVFIGSQPVGDPVLQKSTAAMTSAVNGAPTE